MTTFAHSFGQRDDSSIVAGLPNPIERWLHSGLGPAGMEIEFNVERARERLTAEVAGFFLYA